MSIAGGVGLVLAQVALGILGHKKFQHVKQTITESQWRAHQARFPKFNTQDPTLIWRTTIFEPHRSQFIIIPDPVGGNTFTPPASPPTGFTGGPPAFQSFSPFAPVGGNPAWHSLETSAGLSQQGSGFSGACQGGQRAVWVRRSTSVHLSCQP